jgi:hypothetical protein
VFSPIQTLLKVTIGELQVVTQMNNGVQRRGDSELEVHEGFKVGDLGNKICPIGDLMDGFFWHLLISSN